MRVVYFTFFILLAAMLVVFALLNAGSVDIHYFLGKRTMPLSLLLLAAMMLGFFIGILGTLRSMLHARTKAYRLKKKVHVLQKELDNLRAMPVKDD